MIERAPSASGPQAEHKTVSVPVPHGDTQLVREDLEAFNRRFSPEDVFLDAQDGVVRVHLRKLDVAHAQSVVDELSAATDTGINGHRHILNDVLDAVLGVRSYGLDGRKRNYVDYNRERKVKDRSTKELRRGRHYYANDADFAKEDNIAPAEFTDKIVVGDSEEVLAQLPDNCVDLVFTSPPYNFGLDYGDSADDNAWEQYFDKLFAVFDECIRVLKFGGRIAVNVQPLFSDYIPSHHIISDYFMRRRMIWKGEIMWEKNNYNCKYTAWGSWKSPSSPYLKYTWEFIEVFCKGDLRTRGAAPDADIEAEEFKSWVNARWSVAPERNMQQYGHPAMFPEELAARVLKLFSFRGAFVLDPFAGVGTTAVSAKKHGRRYLGIDVSPEYCATAEQRLSGILL